MSAHSELECAVLIVDDDAVCSRFLAQTLAQIGLKTTVADRCESAKQIFNHNIEQGKSFFIVLLDQNLPDGKGSSLLSWIKQNFAQSSPRIIAVSADIDPSSEKELRAMGFDAVLQKPIARKELFDVIRIATLGSPIDLNPCLAMLRAAPQASQPLLPKDNSAPSGKISVLDDEDALIRCGSKSVLIGLRQILASELNEIWSALIKAVAELNHAERIAILHRAKASAKFCGAMAYASACEKLSVAETEIEIEHSFEVWKHANTQLRIELTQRE